MRISKGVLSAAAAYGIWGVFPIYFKLLHNVPADQIVAHRITWSFVFLAGLIASRRELSAFRAAFTRRTALIYLGSGVLLSINWLTYVWAVNAGFIVEASLGYFINPLVSVLLGVIFLKERLRPVQWVPIALAAAGVAYLTLIHGSLPWIALVLALTFGMYGFIRKVSPLGTLYGLSMETGIVFLPALGYLLLREIQGSGALGHTGALSGLLMILTGVVTAVPLLLFSVGTRSIPLTTLGLLQYITPTLQFLVGVTLYGEPFTTTRLVGFCIIWLALIIFSGESILHLSKRLPPRVTLPSAVES